MKSLQISYLICLFIIGFSCSFLRPDHGVERNLAFYQEEGLGHVYRVYGKQGYLPRKIKIYSRVADLNSELIVKMIDADSITCSTSLNGKTESLKSYEINSTDVSILVENSIASVECVYSGKEQHVDFEVIYKVIKNDEALIEKDLLKAKELDRMVNSLKDIDQSARLLEPPRFCSKELSSPSATFQPTKKLVLGEVGQFCSTPVPTKLNQFITVCDGNYENPYSGQFVIFDSTFKIITRSKLVSSEDLYTLTGSDKPLVRKDKAGKALDIVLATKDGRIIFYDLTGKLKKTIKPESEFIESPIQLADGSLVTVGSDGATGSQQRLYYFDDQDILETIPLPSGISFMPPILLGDNVYLANYNGLLLGFSKDRKKILDVVVEKDKRLSPPVLFNEHSLLIGGQSGALYEVDIETGAKRVFYRAEYTGESEYSLNTNKYEPLRPNIEFAPVVLKDGRVVIATSGDGRIHMIGQDGIAEWQVKTPFVTKLLNFANIPGTDLFITSSITYMTVVRSDGHILARYSNSGAENMFIPHSMSPNRFLLGMFNGVYQFDLKPSLTVTKTELKWPCE